MIRKLCAVAAAAGAIALAAGAAVSASPPAGHKTTPVVMTAYHQHLLLIPAAHHPKFADCFGSEHHLGTAKRGALCFEGALCIATTNAEGHEVLVNCLSRIVKHGIRLVVLNNLKRERYNNITIRLAGYVTDIGVHHWPFRNVLLDHLLGRDEHGGGYNESVVNIHIALKGVEERYECVATAVAAGLPSTVNTTNARDGGCSAEGQFRLNKHGSFMVMRPGIGKYGNEIIVVNFTNASPGSSHWVDISAYDPIDMGRVSDNGPVWNLGHTDSIIDYQKWYRTPLLRK